MPRSAGDPQGCGKVGQRRERLPRCARAAATRAIAYGATRSDSARLTAPSCAPVLGELRRGKINSDPEISSHNSSLNIPLKFIVIPAHPCASVATGRKLWGAFYHRFTDDLVSFRRGFLSTGFDIGF